MILTEGRLTRFLRMPDHVKGGEVKPRAFIPPKGSRVVSTYKTDEITEEEAWGIGRGVASTSKYGLQGRADFQVEVMLGQEAIVASGLQAVFDDTPKWHVNLQDMPELKELEIAVRQELAAISTYLPPPEQLPD